MRNKRASWVSGLLGRQAFRPRVPEGVRVYAIGDIHGRFDLLEQLLTGLKKDAEGAEGHNVLVFLGDYVDRGSQSREVVELLQGLDWPDWEIVPLRGNHDQTILDFLNDPTVYRAWRNFGGIETLLSYGVRPFVVDGPSELETMRSAFARALPSSHRSFLETLRYSYTIGDYMFVHAGVRPSVPLDQQSPGDLMWIREEFLQSDRAFDKVIVHGHTPSNYPVVRPNRICVDTGAYATDRLTAVVLEGEQRSFLSAVQKTDGKSAAVSDMHAALADNS